MSKHTDKTESMVNEFKKDMAYYADKYTFKLRVGNIENKDKAILKDIMDRYQGIYKRANRFHIVTEYKVVSAPENTYGYNCIGCRKRKKGDYMWFGYDLIPLKSKRKEGYVSAWFNYLGKVCSTECGELMTMRMM